jgi:hypothetical protein
VACRHSNPSSSPHGPPAKTACNGNTYVERENERASPMDRSIRSDDARTRRSRRRCHAGDDQTLQPSAAPPLRSCGGGGEAGGRGRTEKEAHQANSKPNGHSSLPPLLACLSLLLSLYYYSPDLSLSLTHTHTRTHRLSHRTHSTSIQPTLSPHATSVVAGEDGLRV